MLTQSNASQRKPSFTFKREGTYYLRYVVPSDLQALVGRVECRVSLKTGSFRESGAKVKRLKGTLDRFMTHIKAIE